MNHFFRRNQKKFLAVFAALLMVMFILPFGTGQLGGGQNGHDPVVAYAGKDEIHASELGNARTDWEMLKRVPIESPRVAMLFGASPFQRMPYAYQLGTLAMQIEQDPELYLLLQKEADQAGVRVGPDRVEDVLRQINLSPNVSPEERAQWQRAVRSFLQVKSLYDRVTSNVKVSEPEVVQRLAQTAQEGTLNLVEFNADEFKAATTAPTNEELQAHFEKYANVPAGLPTTNPSTLPFGYQQPNRVKVQYLSVSQDQVREAVRKSKDAYDWEVAARRYYDRNQREFPVTQPSSAPATNPAAAPASRPFAEVKEDVLAKVMEPEVEKLTQQISAAITERMAADWQKHAKDSASTAPATQPAGYGGFAYLEQLAADIQKQFGVLPSVVSKSDQWLSADDLSNLPGIGSARRTGGGDTFANYVLQSAEAFMPVPQKADAAAVLSVLEPSQPLEDTAGNVYIFRLTDAQAARAPENLAAVRDQVESDLRASRAYQKALEEAKKFAEAAKKDRLPAAAAAAGRSVTPTGAIGRGMFGKGPTTIPNYPTTPETRQQLVDKSYKLLSEATAEAPHPVSLIELPDEKRVVVAELGDVTSRIQADRAYETRLGVTHQMAFQKAQDLAAEWFTSEAVKSRLDYRSLADEGKPATKPSAAS
jgi:hypothetical protein